MPTSRVTVFVMSCSAVLTTAMTAHAAAPPFTMIETTITHDLPAGALARPGGGKSDLGGFNLVIVPGAGLSSNANALAAFNRAAGLWSSLISDPITVTISADLSTTQSNGTAFPSNVIGSTASLSLTAPYDMIRNALVSDAAAQSAAANDGIVTKLPTAAQFTATYPSGRSYSGNLSATKANLKAVGFNTLDASFGATDAQMVFNSGFSFDYNNADGVTAGQEDFESVATHEIGHALGFLSNVDLPDQTTVAQLPSFSPTALDLFRFAKTGANPVSASDFTNFPRNLVPGTEAVTDDTFNEYAMSTGVALGDGRQASHWKDDLLSGAYVGIMDPSLLPGVTEKPTYADYRALDLIGYDLKLWTPGDANHDGSVNFADLVVLAQNYNVTASAVWTNGDFNSDGVVNFADLVILAQNYGTIPSAIVADFSPAFAADWTLAQSLVPEPTALISGLTLAASVIRRRRSR